MPGRLEGKKALITAAAQGIGRATAEKFATEGCKVIATDINLEKLNDLKGIQGITVSRLDVLDKENIARMAKEHEDIDILFNCAGYVHQGTIQDCTEHDFDFSYNLNVKSMFLMCKAFIPNMVKRRSGSIINMSSVASSTKGLPARLAYGTTKAAVIGFTKAMAADYVQYGIRVNCVLPGTVETPSWWERVRAHVDPDQAVKDFIARQKMGRLGRPEEVAHLVTYLASDESTYCTGSEYLIDGGVAL